ncbi:hypothetical protein V6N12_029622 [Hibiscus sabdariffa]|uniref:Uncharacterized protein n=1 Tax=Hibiscus sabdariffa TaxID=183260 RepID=A0ABR2CWN2_9ROSI
MMLSTLRTHQHRILYSRTPSGLSTQSCELQFLHLMASSGTADKTLPLTQTENRHIKNTIPNDDALDSVNPYYNP